MRRAECLVDPGYGGLKQELFARLRLLESAEPSEKHFCGEARWVSLTEQDVLSRTFLDLTSQLQAADLTPVAEQLQIPPTPEPGPVCAMGPSARWGVSRASYFSWLTATLATIESIPSRGFRNLKVLSDPTGASVEFRQNSTGNVMPLRRTNTTFKNVRLGRYLYTISMPGFKSVEGDLDLLEVPPDQTFRCVLQRELDGMCWVANDE
jgi:hypothetical protein